MELKVLFVEDGSILLLKQNESIQKKLLDITGIGREVWGNNVCFKGTTYYFQKYYKLLNSSF